MTIEIPTSIQAEHRGLHEELHAAISAGGKVGQAAQKLAAVLAPHFEKEEAYAMPPLGLLKSLAHGEVIPDVDAAIALVDRLRGEITTMLSEHHQIHAALKDLAETSKAEHRADIADFAERLSRHALNEEEILYPAALLVGQYLKQMRESWE